MASEWQTVRKDRARARDYAKLSIYGDGNGRVNARADRALLDEPAKVHFHVKPSEGLFAIEPADADDPDAYAFSRDESGTHTGAGGDVNTRPAMLDLGLDLDAIEETQHVPLEEQNGMAVADLSGLSGVSSDSGAPETSDDSDSGQTDDDEPLGALYDVPGVGSTKEAALRDAGYGSVGALQQANQAELSNVDSIGNALAARIKAAVGTENDPSPKVVRDAAETVDALSELAAKLDVTTPQAYTLARDAGVLDDLEDDRKRPMGSPSGGGA